MNHLIDLKGPDIKIITGIRRYKKRELIKALLSTLLLKQSLKMDFTDKRLVIL